MPQVLTPGEPQYKIVCVAGARPNFMKVAPILRALAKDPRFVPLLVHTGQHYDPGLSDVFFRDLGMPKPHASLGVGSGSHAVQTGEVLKKFEEVLEREQPEMVLVVGDVNSTLACALAATKYRLQAPFRYRGQTRWRPVVIHVEAGLRSFDDDMPEEANRKMTDAVSDVLLASEQAGVTNLKREGVSLERVFFVGNVMIDSLEATRAQAASSSILETMGLAPASYGVLTLHRASNVDDPAILRALLEALDSAAEVVPLVFPVHPRTRARLANMGVALDAPRWRVTEPLGYADFVRLLQNARIVLTDSGGIQEETTVLGVPCVTIRDNTERPCTVSEGTNILAGTQPAAVVSAFMRALEDKRQKRVPALWDGRAAERIAKVLGDLIEEPVEQPLEAAAAS